MSGSYVFAGFVAILASLATGAVAQMPPVDTSHDPPPEGVTQILPRGRLEAIVNPRFVSAEEAEIPDDAWILGVAREGEAHAYSLNLLNHHEVVNDRIGDAHFAAVW